VRWSGPFTRRDNRRTAHLETFAKRLERFARHVIVLRGGQSEKQRRDIAARLAAIPQTKERVIVATGTLPR